MTTTTGKKPLVKPKQADTNPLRKPDKNVKIENPSCLDFPIFMMCFPHTWDTDDPNNVWMKKLSQAEIDEDWAKCYGQWMQLYNMLAGPDVLVKILEPAGDYPDQIYVANVGIVLCHQDKPVFVGANYKSPPRRGEEKVAIEQFKLAKYKTDRPPFFFEGEADLKHIVKNHYIGAWGIRTEKKALEWFEKQYDMHVIPVEMTDERNYHLDTEIFPLTAEKVVVATSLLKPEEIKAIEKICEIIPVPKKLQYAAPTNCVRTQNTVLCGSTLEDLKPTDDAWQEELDKRHFWEETCAKNNFALLMPNLSEISKSGADLSCCVLHVNRAAYAHKLD